MIERRRHLFIGGTGRSGTSFLVQYLTGLGLDTHVARRGEGAWWNDAANAGLEDFPFGADATQLPYVIKQPFLNEFIDQVLSDPAIQVDGIIIPVRGLVEAATSRTLNELRGAYERIPQLAEMDKAWETMGHTAGGVVFSMNPVDQGRLLAVGFHLLVERLVRADVPFVFLDFRRLVEDADYLYGKLQPFVGDATLELAREVHAKLADPSKVRVEQETGASGSGGTVAVKYADFERLDAVALRREVARLRQNFDVLEERSAESERALAEQQLLGERQRTHIDDLERLRIRHADERRKLTASLTEESAQHAELRRQHDKTALALRLISEQFASLFAERAELERQIHRLEVDASESRRRTIEAELAQHEFLMPYVSGRDRSQVSEPDGPTAALLSQLGALDERVNQPPRSSWRSLFEGRR